MKNETDKLAGILEGMGIKPAVFNNGYDVPEYVQSGAAVDLCFLDIVMPGISGVELAEELRKDGYTGEIVFLTTVNDFAHQAFRVKAFDYLLKPPTPESVGGIIDALKTSRENTDAASIAVQTPGKSTSVFLREISYVEVIDHYVHFRLTNGADVTVRSAFEEIAARLLTDKRFIRCHRSYIVNMSYVKTVTSRDIVMRGGTEILISRSYSGVKDTIAKWMIGGVGK
jgi:DNA-binding LytR/AlgR family response regulator